MTATGALAVPLRSTLATHPIGENAEGDARECVKGCYSQAHTDQEPILHHRGDDVQPEHQRGGDPHEDDTAADHDVRVVHGLGSTVPTRDYLTVAVMAAMAARGGHGQSPCRRSALRAAGRGRRRDAD